MKILIAEDDYTSRRILESVLQKWGYETISVDNGKDALDKLLEDDAPKFAILDWVMPRMDGIDVCTKLKQKQTNEVTYIILLTARDNKQDIIKGLEAGANDYISKPFDNDELHARIKVGKRIIELQQSLLEKDKLQVVLETAGMICHEINQPLMTISGYSEILLMDYEEDEKLAPTIKIINEQAIRLGKITSKLMKITRYKTKNYLKSNIIDLEKASENNNSNK
jgi:sigma-B regulation protein RsbU (phosphoserine phosphatase)